MERKKLIAYIAAALFGITGTILMVAPDVIFGKAYYEGLSGISEGIGRFFYGIILVAICLVLLALTALQKSSDSHDSKLNIPWFVLLLIGLGFVSYAYFSYTGYIARSWSSELTESLYTAIGAIFLGFGFTRLFQRSAK